MSDDITRQTVLFPNLFRRPVVAKFDQRYGSSDGGAILLKACDERLGLTQRLASCVADARQAGKVGGLVANNRTGALAGPAAIHFAGFACFLS